MMHEKTAHAAKGMWKGILMSMGIPDAALTNKHGACPMCGGIARFRWDNKEGKGTYFCSQCGAGDGMKLAQEFTGKPFFEVATEIDALLGNQKFERDKPKPDTSGQHRKWRKELWQASKPITDGDDVDRYLKGRGVDRSSYGKVLRVNTNCRYSESESYPAMIAAIQDQDGQGVSLHRTFLKDGKKAPVERPRMVMPGDLPAGSAVRLGEAGSFMGIAEGIETALAAWDIFGVVTWAALNAHLLSEWMPPTSVKQVYIFGDNDASFTGQAASYALAKRLHRKGIEVVMQIAPETGKDWADMHSEGYEINA